MKIAGMIHFCWSQSIFAAIQKPIDQNCYWGKWLPVQPTAAASVLLSILTHPNNSSVPAEQLGEATHAAVT